MRPRVRALALAFALGWTVVAPAQEPEKPADPTDLVNAVLTALSGFSDLSEAELQSEVADIGGVPFKHPVPLEYMTHAELAKYLRQMFDEEYPADRAMVDQRLLTAFDLLPEEVDLREERGRLLLDNIAGFYDERPDRRRLYAVSEEHRLTPANQIVMAHELRHALQDQYMDVQGLLPESVGDFDDRRLALLSLLEGDATLVMEAFLMRRLPGVPEGAFADLSGVTLPDDGMAGTPAVLRDQLVKPYFAGRDFVRALVQQGGWARVKEAWSHPPASSEQILHPEKYTAGDAPRPVSVDYAPTGGKLLGDGVLGELLLRTFLGEGREDAAAGWGGDHYRLWDVKGRTLLVWRSVWDAPEAARQFTDAARGRLEASHGAGRPEGAWTVYRRNGWIVALGAAGGSPMLLASNDERALKAAQDANP